MKPRIVIDTNSIVSALKSRRGAANRLLHLIGTKKFVHSLSVPYATKELAKKEHISVERFIMLAIAEKMSALGAQDFIEKRGKRGSRQRFLKVLESAPDVEPEEDDKI